MIPIPPITPRSERFLTAPTTRTHTHPKLPILWRTGSLCWLLCFMGCSALGTQYQSCHRPLVPQLHTTTPDGKKLKIRVEIACTPDERQRGLMHRKHLPSKHGMLFIFAQPDTQSFWMKDTYIPLDMIHLDQQKRVVGIVENAKPHSTESRTIDKKSIYVLEVNAFFARKHRISVGQTFSFVDIPYCNP